MCGRCFALQAALAQVTKDTAFVFHWERRERVLLRDIFRFGTATVLLLYLFVDDQPGQFLPPRINRFIVRV